MTDAAKRDRGEAVDWSELRRRMDQLGEVLEKGPGRSATEIRQVLDERARELARPRAAAAEEEDLEVITFRRKEEQYALETRHIHEVMPLGPVALLPGVAAPVAGAVGLRGEILVLVELAPAAEGLPPAGQVIVVGAARPAFGVVADEVVGLERLALSTLRETRPEAGVAEARLPLRGITDEGVLVLNGAELIRTHA